MSLKKSKKKQSQKDGLSSEIRGSLMIAVSLVTLLSILSFAYCEKNPNWLGLAGFTIGWFATALFGLNSYLLCLYLGWFGWRRLFSKSINFPIFKHLNMAVLVISIGILLSLAEDLLPSFSQWIRRVFYTQLWNQNMKFHIGGAPFSYLYHDLPGLNLSRTLNTMGVSLIFLSSLVGSFFIFTKTSPRILLCALSDFYAKTKDCFQKEAAPISSSSQDGFFRYVKLKIPSMSPAQTAPLPLTELAKSDMLAIRPEKNLQERPSLSRKETRSKLPQVPIELSKNHPPAPAAALPEESKKQKREAALAAQRVYNGDFKGYQLPPLTLLTNPRKVDQSSLKKDLRHQAEVLEETLHSFGIEAKVGQINCGPTITSFEVHPAIGVKVQKIKTLENDIALNMEAKSIRIQAPIPGKAAIGIEVPNAHPQEVAFKDMLNAYLQGSRKFHIPTLLGKTVNGEYVMEDLNRMPHLIIAGATGSGKSVCINTFVMSILMTAKPDEIKMIMVDPKKVELTPYSKLPHMLAPVITEPAGACAALSWLVKEMERRYEILKQVGLRHISAFNSRTINKEFETSLDREIPEKMHYIVCIIDELADLMMVSSNDIETYIARIAQMARAVGIHLILATQRPSREVITGLIKANFPTRIAFKVSSRVNSQIILDETGAESLLGNGDLLFLPPGSHHLIRAQGAYIRDDDINAVVEFICKQVPPNYVIQSFDDMDASDNALGSEMDQESDALYKQARQIVLSAGNASATFLQKKFKIGYARASRLIDELEASGVISAAEGSKPRKVLAKSGDDNVDEGV
ncbi:MAG TPA: DNA translocase FtsK [Waddliaceae bacterium]